MYLHSGLVICRRNILGCDARNCVVDEAASARATHSDQDGENEAKFNELITSFLYQIGRKQRQKFCLMQDNASHLPSYVATDLSIAEKIFLFLRSSFIARRTARTGGKLTIESNTPESAKFISHHNTMMAMLSGSDFILDSKGT